MGDKKCRSVGQCILGLKARLVSASPRQGGQPAGLRRELELTGIGAGGEVPGCPHWPRGAPLRGRRRTDIRGPVRTVSAGQAEQLLPSACV